MTKNRNNCAIRLPVKSVWLLLMGMVSGPIYAEPEEAALRVAFVYNFIKFIEWPKEETGHAVNLCSSTTDTEARNALHHLKGKTANKRVIELIYLHTGDLSSSELSPCHMLYLTHASASKRLPDPLPNGLVLVADEPEDEDSNVSISLLRNNRGRIEFIINTQAVNQAGVNISSQLLKLAKNSRERGG